MTSAKPAPAGPLCDEGALREVYDPASKGVQDKSLPRLDAHARRFLELSPFFCIGTSRADGAADVSPRGGEPGFVHVLNDTHIAFPDRPGNNRLDTLTNIVENAEVGMLFFLPGVEDMMRINGVAELTTAPVLMERFVRDGKAPRSVAVVRLREVYFHCSKALRRSQLWNPATHVPKGGFPTLGRIMKDQLDLAVPAGLIDMELAKDATDNLY